MFDFIKTFFRRTDLSKVAGVRGESFCHDLEVRSSLHISRWPCNLPPRLLVAGASRGSTIKVRGRSWQSISRGVYSKHKERPRPLSVLYILMCLMWAPSVDDLPEPACSVLRGGHPTGLPHSPNYLYDFVNKYLKNAL